MDKAYFNEYYKTINECRKYLDVLEEITEQFDRLPDIDDASFSFYEYLLDLIVKEENRVRNKLKRIESEVKQ